MLVVVLELVQSRVQEPGLPQQPVQPLVQPPERLLLPLLLPFQDRRLLQKRLAWLWPLAFRWLCQPLLQRVLGLRQEAVPPSVGRVLLGLEAELVLRRGAERSGQPWLAFLKLAQIWRPLQKVLAVERRLKKPLFHSLALAQAGRGLQRRALLQVRRQLLTANRGLILVGPKRIQDLANTG